MQGQTKGEPAPLDYETMEGHGNVRESIVVKAQLETSHYLHIYTHLKIGKL